jgi:2-polyprenyl-6-methoxyphenol hydroxylase-like FAD-dependent oxidoreductase
MRSEKIPTAPNSSPQPNAILATRETSCCIVGAGPAGATLALFLARKGVSVLLLEEHMDFDRDFRGDTIHPSTMFVLDQIGLARKLLELPHGEVHSMTIQTERGPFTPVDFGRLRTPYPFITMQPQADFLRFITGEAARYPNFSLVMGARVEALILDGERTLGVRYRGQDGWYEARAPLTVGCDGRFSRLRKLGGFTPVTTSSPLDVLWFRLPRRDDDPPDAIARFSRGHVLVMLNRGAQWQIASLIPKGGYQALRAAGIEALRQALVAAAPEMADRAELLQSWKQVSLLSVASDRLRRWYRPGLLLIGDAAHTMSPVAGVGINYAIQDAVATANAVYAPLCAGAVEEPTLALVQRRRDLPTRLMQGLQAQIQDRALAPLMRSAGELRIPGILQWALRLPGIRLAPAFVIGIGLRPEKLRAELIQAVDVGQAERGSGNDA